MLIIEYFVLTLFLIVIRKYINSGDLYIFLLRGILILLLIATEFMINSAYYKTTYKLFILLTYIYGVIITLL